MMRTFKMVMLTALLLGLCIGTLFAGGFALSGVGSRATAMGGAFRGLADDPSAMFWNPAGMAFMDETSISLGGTFIMPSAEWENNGPYFTAVPGYENKIYEAESSLRSFPNFFATFAKGSKMKYGIGLFVPYGLGTTWDAYQQPAMFAGFTDFPKEEMLSSIAILDLHPTIAYQIMPKLSFGAGLSIYYGMIDLAKVQFSSPDTGFLPTTSDMSGTGIGYGANAGLMYKPTQSLSIGVAGKILSNIKMEGEIEVATWIPPSTKVGGKSDIETTLKLPGEIGVGVSYMITPKWRMNLDYAYTMWERLDKVVVELDDPITVHPNPLVPQLSRSEIVFDWEDTYRVSLGTEFMLGSNAWRLGVYMDETPIPVETQTATLSDIGTKISSNIGWGRSFGKFGLDANFQYVMFEEREVETQTATNMAGVYNANSISGNIGLSYKF
jgi:long-chain fatty acid transport protein